MHVDVAFSGSVVSVEALVKFLKLLEQLVPAPVKTAKVTPHVLALPSPDYSPTQKTD
jgi:hypothetical protein